MVDWSALVPLHKIHDFDVELPALPLQGSLLLPTKHVKSWCTSIKRLTALKALADTFRDKSGRRGCKLAQVGATTWLLTTTTQQRPVLRPCGEPGEGCRWVADSRSFFKPLEVVFRRANQQQEHPQVLKGMTKSRCRASNQPR